MYGFLNGDGCKWRGRGREWGGGGGGEREHERNKQVKGALDGWVRRQTEFVVAVESIDHLLIVVF